MSSIDFILNILALECHKNIIKSLWNFIHAMHIFFNVVFFLPLILNRLPDVQQKTFAQHNISIFFHKKT